MSDRVRPILAMLVPLIIVIDICGCRSTPRTQSGMIDRMACMVGAKPDDTNNNGYPDRIQVTVALFSSPRPASVTTPGAFTFELYHKGMVGASYAKPFGIWKFGPDDAREFVTRAQFGPCYQFQLDMLQMGSDEMPLKHADLICKFYPSDGSPTVYSDGVRTIQIGRNQTASAPER